MLNPFGIMRIRKYPVLTGQQCNPPERTDRYARLYDAVGQGQAIQQCDNETMKQCSNGAMQLTRTYRRVMHQSSNQATLVNASKQEFANYRSPSTKTIVCALPFRKIFMVTLSPG